MSKKTIGLIGGISPESTILYYNKFNELISQKYGEYHTANILIRTLDFKLVSKLRANNNWEELFNLISDAILTLEKAGADFIVFSSNSVIFPLRERVFSSFKIPIIDIVEESIKSILKQGLNKVFVIGSKYVMQEELYSETFKKYGLKVILPDDIEKRYIHENIYSEIAYGITTPIARQNYINIINKFIEKERIQGVVFASTDLSYLLSQEHLDIPLINATDICVEKAIEMTEIN